MSKTIADIAVVGAGIIGTTIAERLQFEGKKVLLIDRDQPGNGCSKGNAGHFASDIILPIANLGTILKVPKLLLDPLGPLTIDWSYFPQLLPWLIRYTWAAMPHKTKQTIAALKLLNRPSINSYRALLKRTGLESLMTQNGALTVYRSLQSAKETHKHAKTVARHGVKVEHLNGDQIRELEPNLSTSILGGLFYPETAHSINPHKLVTSLVDSFTENGGRLVQQSVHSIQKRDLTQLRLTTDGVDIAAKEVIIACGAWSKKLAATVGHNVPLETERGYHLMLAEPNTSVTRPVTSFERSFVMTPMQEGLRLAGTVELAGLKAPPNYSRANKLFEHAKEILPALENNRATRWMGHRPSLPDSLPVIDRSKKDNRVLFAFGHQHLGFTQAAVTAEMISRLVHGDPQIDDLQPFRIERF